MPGPTVYDQDEPIVGASGLPVVESMPRRTPAGAPRHAHAVSKPTRRERRALRKQRVRERPPSGATRRRRSSSCSMILLSPVWASMGQAATNPALGPTPGSRLTEWVRDHGGGGIVTWAEDTWYTWHAPPKGGKPAAGAIPKPTSAASDLDPATRHRAGPPPRPGAHRAVRLDPHPRRGSVAPHRTHRRRGADHVRRLHPSERRLHQPGDRSGMDGHQAAERPVQCRNDYPGHRPVVRQHGPIAAAARSTLDAAFNSGFRMQDSQGGFYLDGITAEPLKTGAASAVIDSSGNINIGAWGTDVAMTPSTVAVRQNLDLIVDNGAPVPGLNQNDNYRWGATLGGKVQVWRSGLGVTATGALVYVAGNDLSIVDLANVLARAGAVRAMELDINTAWVNFTHFDLNPGVPATDDNGVRLTYDEEAIAEPVLLPAVPRLLHHVGAAVPGAGGDVPLPVQLGSAGRPPAPTRCALVPQPDRSATVARTHTITKSRYEHELLRLQAELTTMTEWVKEAGARVVVVFEGRDAAGKGGRDQADQRVPAARSAAPSRCRRRRSASGAVVLPALRRRAAGGRRDHPVRPQLVQPGRGRARHGLLHLRGVPPVPPPVPGVRAPADRGRRHPGQVLVLGQRRGAGAPVPDTGRRSPPAVEAERDRPRGPPTLVGLPRAKDAMFLHTDTPESPWYVVDAEDKRRARLNCIAHLLSRIPYSHVDEARLKLPKRVKDDGYRRPPRDLYTYVPTSPRPWWTEEVSGHPPTWRTVPAQPGMRRHTARGSWRITANTHRSTGGA